MPLKIYNTANRQKETFEPIAPPVVTMYNCGPTVYDFFHIGNARNFVVVDVVRRWLETKGYDVRFVQNFTDIDDKIIKRANENGEKWDALAERFIEEYFKAADALNVRRATVHAKCTHHINEMLALVAKLVEKGLAYPLNGDVYFRVRRFQSYGALSGKNIDDLQEGARVDVAEQKEDPLDFALWKAAKPGEPAWESPWGSGRPGWHLECSAMSMHHLGETIDIHSGGTDLVFPHHENERAQSEGATGKPFVRTWMHNGFLTIDSEKMSKSLGNFSSIRDVLDRYEAPVVRYYLLSAHYRHPLDYSDKALDEASRAVARIREAVATARKLLGLASQTAGNEGMPDDALAKLSDDFAAALDDDFNTPKAYAVIFEAVTLLNERRAQLNAGAAGTAAGVAAVCDFIAAKFSILGLEGVVADGETAGGADEAFVASLMDILIKLRQEARASKQYALGDLVRDELAKVGVRLQDHKSGTIWLRE